MKATDFDKAFDDGEDIDDLVDWTSGSRPNLDQRRLEIEIPVWMVRNVNQRARELGLTPQALIQSWVAEKLR